MEPIVESFFKKNIVKQPFIIINGDGTGTSATLIVNGFIQSTNLDNADEGYTSIPVIIEKKLKEKSY